MVSFVLGGFVFSGIRFGFVILFLMVLHTEIKSDRPFLL